MKFIKEINSNAITDAVCLKLINSSEILVGLGNSLKYFYHINGETKNQTILKLFYDKVHGIECTKLKDDCHSNTFLIVCHGGREFASFLLKDYTLELIKVTKITDWINSIHLYENATNFCLVTSHNVVHHVNVNLKGSHYDFIQNSKSEESSTLYCSKIIGVDWKSTVVFAGTALGEILVWCPIDGMNCDKRAKIFHRLSGHNGVIFSIDVDVKSRLMTTTSDDRSVRLWHIDGDDCVKKYVFRPGKKLYGHIARVFQSKIINESEQIFIITVGEDSNVCLWQTDGKLLLKKKIVSGGTIWNLDFCIVTKTIFTSSSDGNITKIDIGSYLKKQATVIENITEIPFKKNEINCKDSEYISKIKYLGTEFMIGFSNMNILYFRGYGENEVWSGICDLDKNKPSVLEVSSNRIAFARYEMVTILEFSNRTVSISASIELPNSMIRSFHFLVNTDESLVCDDKGKLVLLNKNYEIFAEAVLPLCKERWSTSALRFADFLLVADRCGHLHCFKISSEHQLILVATLKNVHGNLGITQMSLSCDTDAYFTFKTIGHDGCQKTIEIDKITFKMMPTLTEKLNILWIENCIKLPQRNEDLYFGFNDNHFVLAGKYAGIICEYECGGGHRNWDYRVSDNGQNFNFLFVRNKKLFEFKIPLQSGNSNSLQFKLNNLHKRACNILTSVKNIDEIVLISGGDDNILKLQDLTNLEINHLNDLYAHISNIRCITLIPLSSHNQYLIISGGGRAQLCFTNISLAPYRVKELTHFMLKSSDFERKKMGKTQEIDFDPETRFMSVDYMPINDENNYKLITGCSDGFIREFLIKYLNESLEIVESKSIYYGRCILNVHIIEELAILVTMATDGLICFWDLNSFETGNHLIKLKHHRSGVNCFDAWYNSATKMFQIATGGDDQNVVISFMKIEKIGDKLNIQTTGTIENSTLHTAQVTGVKFIDNQILCSVGVDQVLNFMNANDLSLILKRCSCVADVKGLHCILGDYQKLQIIVYGQGMEVIEFEK